MKYLRSLGQLEGRAGFECEVPGEEVERYLEVSECEFGELRAVRHAAEADRFITGWERMPRVLGSDVPEWL